MGLFMLPLLPLRKSAGSCKSLLIYSIHHSFISLAHTDNNRTETATRLGYHLEDSIAIIESDWVGYDFRRHQSGKSFKQRVGPCFHYCFRYDY